MNDAREGEATPSPQRRVAISADGTPIEYFSVGSGAPVIVVPGALSRAQDYLRFAHALGEHMRVHLMQRRGRGRSGPQGVDYSMERECEDLLAVRADTGARAVVGHSFGGLVVLEAARKSPAFDRIALYEPGVSIAGSISIAWLDRYEALLAEGKESDAFALFSTGTGPDRGRRTPLWLMKLLLPRFVSAERRATMYPLLKQNGLEHRAVRECNDHLPTYAAVQASVLIMKGGRSGTAWVNLATAGLARTLPRSRTIEFARLDHFGMDQGDPETVAAATAHFLAQ